MSAVNLFTLKATSDIEDTMQLSDGIKTRQKIFHQGSITVEGKKWFFSRENNQSTFVLVRTRHGVMLSENTSQPHFSRSNTWIGADCFSGGRILFHAGKFVDPCKTQLFRMCQGESIIFFDAAREASLITAKTCGEKPEIRRASNKEVSKYVLNEAFARGDNPSTRTWCFYALRELGCVAEMEVFSRRFPNFHSQA